MSNFTEEENQTTQCDNDLAYNPPFPTPTNFSVSRSSTSQLRQSYLHLGFCISSIQIIIFISIPIRSMYYPNELLKKSAQWRCHLSAFFATFRARISTFNGEALFTVEYVSLFGKGKRCSQKHINYVKHKTINTMAKENADLTSYVLLCLNHNFCSFLSISYSKVPWGPEIFSHVLRGASSAAGRLVFGLRPGHFLRLIKTGNRAEKPLLPRVTVKRK